MRQDENRTDGKSIVVGPPIVLPKNSPDRVFVRKTVGIDIDEGSTTNLTSPFSIGGGSGGGLGSTPPDPNLPTVLDDIPQLTDIENITYQQYYDTFNSIRIKAIIKIRNSSKNKSNVVGVDARNEPRDRPLAQLLQLLQDLLCLLQRFLLLNLIELEPLLLGAGIMLLDLDPILQFHMNGK